MMGPAEEERAWGADTSLPGRKALCTPFQEGTAVCRPGCAWALAFQGPWAPRTHARGCAWLGCESRFSCQTGLRAVYESVTHTIVRPDQTESVWCEVT